MIILIFIICHIDAYSQEFVSIRSSGYEIIDDNLRGYYAQVTGIEPEHIVNTNLYVEIESWLGTPYRYAGNTMKGVDCSAFVSNIYKDAYSAIISGNSLSFYQNSKAVKKNELKEGDLVFFKINRKKVVSHVGVYLGNNKFAHASRSNGVIISNLEDPYYKRYFVRGGRMLSTTK
jgi:murein DD-endopeptidase / murein LD-carboxypeptidase